MEQQDAELFARLRAALQASEAALKTATAKRLASEAALKTATAKRLASEAALKTAIAMRQASEAALKTVIAMRQDSEADLKASIAELLAARAALQAARAALQASGEPGFLERMRYIFCWDSFDSLCGTGVPLRGAALQALWHLSAHVVPASQAALRAASGASAAAGAVGEGVRHGTRLALGEHPGSSGSRDVYACSAEASDVVMVAVAGGGWGAGGLCAKVARVSTPYVQVSFAQEASALLLLRVAAAMAAVVLSLLLVTRMGRRQRDARARAAPRQGCCASYWPWRRAAAWAWCTAT